MSNVPQRLDHRETESKSYFDQWAKNYDSGRISRWFQYTQNLALKTFELHPDSKVLDVGCGTGYATRELASFLPRGKACGIDISFQMIREALRGAPADFQERTEFIQANSASIPYQDCTFTHLLCTNSFHHYPEPLEVLKEMKRVLTPGGQLVIFENAPELSWYTWAWDRFLRLIEKGHVRYYPSHELGEMIERAGFERGRLCVLRNVFLKYGKLFASIQLWSAIKPSGCSKDLPGRL